MKNENLLDKNNINIEDELKNSYLDYAMSVIISRALPDVRDGLKPVHRRILYAMSILKNDFNKPYKKSARIVGDVIGKYHPHGDNSVYDAIVRMSQKFSLRYTLIDGQGNFGSIDGDPAAAMRYTEIRMSKISHELMIDIDKDTVDFISNYDNSEYMPKILPSRIPNLLINGSYGIAVGVATNIPPHNISEVINACLEIIKNENISTKELIKFIKGPDFPTGAIIINKEEIENIYKTGKGKLCIRSKISIENNNNNKSIIIEEIPYQVNKIKLIEKINELIKYKKIDGIENINDESNQEGIRIVINIKNEYSENIILNNLYKNTSLQSNLYVNMVALDDLKPKLMSLKEILLSFINHRKNIIYRKNLFLFKKYNEKIHILEGFILSINNIDNIINIIKNSNSINDAKNNLKKIIININDEFKNLKDKYNKIISNIYDNNLININYENYYFSNSQIQSILDIKLQRLTNLEYKNLINEYNIILEKLDNCISIIKFKNKLKDFIYKELLEIKSLYKDKRLTNIIDENYIDKNENLIENFKVLVTLSYQGYIKYQPLSNYIAQKRGGKGKLSTIIKSEDFINCLLVSYTNDDILFFSNRGRMFRIKTYKLPISNRNSKGKPILNLIPIEKYERITAMLSIKINEINESNYIFMSTLKGYVKKIYIKELIKSRKSGFIVIKLNNYDELVDVNITNSKNNIMLFSKMGKVVNFLENKVRSTSRMSHGVKGINLFKNDIVVSLIISNRYINKNNQILTITKNGFGKRTYENEYPIKSRANNGIISIKINNKTGNVIKSIKVNENDQILIITNLGKLVRIRVSEIRISSRNTSGVRLIKTSNNENVVDLKRIIDDNI